MTTIIAGLGVGGIAIALAAQQTIANIFGGVSRDRRLTGPGGGFRGSFGGVLGTVEDIGLRACSASRQDFEPHHGQHSQFIVCRNESRELRSA